MRTGFRGRPPPRFSRASGHDSMGQLAGVKTFAFTSTFATGESFPPQHHVRVRRMEADMLTEDPELGSSRVRRPVQLLTVPVRQNVSNRQYIGRRCSRDLAPKRVQSIYAYTRRARTTRARVLDDDRQWEDRARRRSINRTHLHRAVQAADQTGLLTRPAHQRAHGGAGRGSVGGSRVSEGGRRPFAPRSPSQHAFRHPVRLKFRLNACRNPYTELGP